ncbi:hypothetical protein [Streptomyces coeruleorubidus]|uniref:hypothetical protein n=1 Tax=Streptomyces coeruleorubidus TaxID=116188 RepID=UPI0037AAA8C1
MIPDGTDWDNVLGWLVQRALPQYVPGALRRARSPFFVDPDLQSAGEQAARQALEDLEERFADEKRLLEQALREAKEKVEPVRYGLLYGSGSELVDAVAQVLSDAGLRVDLDQELGGSRSADLLVSADAVPARRLVEVKGVSGPPPGRASSAASGDLAAAAARGAGLRRRADRQSSAQAASVGEVRGGVHAARVRRLAELAAGDGHQHGGVVQLVHR